MALAVKGAGSRGHAAGLSKVIPCPRSMGHQAVHPHLHHQCSPRDEERRQSTNPLPFPRALLTLCSGRALGRVCEPRRVRGPQGHGTFALIFSPGERLVWEHLGVLEKQVHAVRQTCENSTALGQSRGASWEPHDAAGLFPQGPASRQPSSSFSPALGRWGSWRLSPQLRSPHGTSTLVVLFFEVLGLRLGGTYA